MSNNVFRHALNTFDQVRSNTAFWVKAQTERLTAKAYREALEDLLLAKTNLADIRTKVPNLQRNGTGQWDDADYTRDEEQTLIAASHVFEDAMVASLTSSPS